MDAHAVGADPLASAAPTDTPRDTTPTALIVGVGLVLAVALAQCMREILPFRWAFVIAAGVAFVRTRMLVKVSGRCNAGRK